MSLPPLFALFADAALRDPEKTALIIGPRRLSYAELAASVENLAAHWQDAGVRAGDHVGVVAPNGVPFVQFMLAAARLGAVLVPQPLGTPTDALLRAFATTRVRHLAVWHGLLSSSDMLSALGSIDGVRVSIGGDMPPRGWHRFEAWLEPATLTATAPHHEPGTTHPFLMVLTSGSTGQPKPIVLHQEVKIARARAAIGLYRLGEEDCILAATPLYHSLAQRLVIIPLIMGATSVVMEHFSPALWCAAIAEHRCSFTIAVSSQLKQTLPELHKQTHDLGSLKRIVSSSALLDGPTKAALLGALRCKFHECYGTSEIATATDLHAQADANGLGSVGRPVPGAIIRILDPHGEFVPTGEVGEIVCCTPLAFNGYFDQPDLTGAAYHDAFFRTGDIGRIDADGYLYYEGRLKDIVITGGINIYPRDVEEVLQAYPEVYDCAVIAVEDEQLGEVVGAVLATGRTNGEGCINLRAVQRLCAERLNDAQQPRHYFVVDQLPMNAMGKIDKEAMRRQFGSGKFASVK